jgi:hypothetical protein
MWNQVNADRDSLSDESARMRRYGAPVDRAGRALSQAPGIGFELHGEAWQEFQSVLGERRP